MSDAIIIFEHVCKRYQVGQGRYFQRGYLANQLLELIKPAQSRQQADCELWALKDVCFEIRRGETVGLIGSNGAGKSTVLKIVSRITKPTRGRVGVKGRVGSLLQLGAGFHPDLTGRENIRLAGSLLGMKNAEIQCQFDQIVEFSGVEQMIDTPVKYYSTGQYMRLGFAVVAHLNHEILIVDEALAVGDKQFQARCLAKMRSLVNDGRTVLFVSHRLEQLENLCQKVLWLESGKVIEFGQTAEILRSYAGQTAAAAL